MDARFFRKDAPEDRFDIRIDRHGQWFHQERPMTREALAKLFSSVLHYDVKKQEYWLITPVEQGRIEVEDVPYMITAMEVANKGSENQSLSFTTSLGHITTISEARPLECSKDNSDTIYAVFKNNIRGKLNRAIREELINLALSQNGFDDETKTVSIVSNGARFIIAKMVS